MTLLTIGKPFQLVNSTCTRTSWPNGTLFEFVEFDRSEPTEAQQAHLEKLIARIPIDGKEHTFAEMGCGL